jgi:hypothetical protein
MIDRGECIRERPDLLLDVGTHFVIVEIDEHQHHERACECEIARMVNIGQSLGGAPSVFIRYNPDTFRCMNSKKKIDPSFTSRMRVLLDWIRTISREMPNDFTSAVYLFYDDYKASNTTTQCIA